MRAARDLARQVRQERQRFIDQALGVNWRASPAEVKFADPDPATTVRPMVELLVNWQDVDGGLAGSLNDISEFYRTQGNGRLVILGAPGSGKSMLLSCLARDLIRDSPLPDPAEGGSSVLHIPVMLSLPSCNLGDIEHASQQELSRRLDEWIVSVLHEQYSISGAAARSLLKEGHILPVLDGLDEMDPSSPDMALDPASRPRASAVIKALNFDRERAFVLACRNVEYQQMAVLPREPGVPKLMLTDARHVTLRPLATADVASYLESRFGGAKGEVPARWQSVTHALALQDPMASMLQSPWQLFLAVTKYEDEDAEPAELLEGDYRETKSRLLSGLIPAVCSHDDVALRHGWTADKVERWLRCIALNHDARTTASGFSSTDICVPDLWRVCDRNYPRIVPALVCGLSSLGATYLYWRLALHLWVDWAFIAVFVLLGIWGIIWTLSPESPLKRADMSGLKTRRGLRRYAVNIFGGAIGGAALGAALDFIVGEGQVGLPIGLVLGLAGGVLSATGSDMVMTPSSSVLVRQCVNAVMVFAVVLYLITVFMYVYTGGTPTDALGTSFVVLFPLFLATNMSLAFRDGYVWLRYALGVHSAARRDLVPRRLARFMDWCVSVGLMRMTGTNTQFRHREFQDWLSGDHLEES